MATKNDMKLNNNTTGVSRAQIISISAVVALITALLTSVLSGGIAVLVNRQMYRSDKSNIEAQRQVVSSEGEVIADIAEKVGPSVVSILVERQLGGDVFFGPRAAQSAGTGLIIDSSGLILTNKHVVPSGVGDVTIMMSDGTRYDSVKVVGRDPLNDLAFLKVDNPRNFQAARLGNSDAIRIGQKVVAIGNTLGEFQNSVTSGIISGIGRPVAASGGTGSEQLTNLLQTDAAINSGNSGGPLLNLSGEVIGINTAIAAGAENVGFAIPINEAKGLIEGVKQTGTVSRPYLGVRYIHISESLADQMNLSVDHGAYLSREGGSILAGGPAAKAGLKPGDVILAVDDSDVTIESPLTTLISRYKVGDTVDLTILRDGEEQVIKVKLESAPEQP